MVAALLAAPNRAPLTAAERVDVLEAQLREVMRAHNELADAVLALSVQLNGALAAWARLSGEASDAAELPLREPFKRHGKRH